MTEDINQKIAQIPFIILYIISSSIITFDLVFTYFFLNNNPNAFEGSPINAYFAKVFSNNYFLAVIPLVLLLLFVAAKITYLFIKNFYPKSLVKGDNYIIVTVILVTLPNVLLNEVLVLLLDIKPIMDFKGSLISGLVLAGVFIALSEIAEAKAKKSVPITS